jgi:hypothetical protein
MENENILVQFLVAGISGGIIVLLVYLGKKAENIHLWGKRKELVKLESELNNSPLKENLNNELLRKSSKKIKGEIIHLANRIKGFIKKNYKIILIIIGIIFVFYWIQIRPSIIKINCYDEAVKISIEEMRIEKSKPFLYDRDNWKNYKTKDLSYESFLESKGRIFKDLFINNSLSKNTFEENIKNGTEPAYIKENLERISKENDFYDEDYDKYYKRCLEKKGF